jgi:hypothetical protein
MVTSSDSQLNLNIEVFSIGIIAPRTGMRLLQTADEDLLELAEKCE